MLVEELFAEEGEKRRVFTVSCKQPNLRLLTERAALGQASLTAGRLREHLGARAADNHGLGVREDGGDSEAARALDVHEERVGVLHKSLELVRASLLLGGGVQKVDSESLSSDNQTRVSQRVSDSVRLHNKVSRKVSQRSVKFQAGWRFSACVEVDDFQEARLAGWCASQSAMRFANAEYCSVVRQPACLSWMQSTDTM